ncbi:MAG: polysaccharide pyruvyl transferase family protein [Prevotella sp.]|nr:polysaccharide pyruvyl transferase family protein [Prevotella sp.]
MTYWQTADNYGQVLQCYALQQILRAAGHEAFVIRYDLKRRPHKVSFIRCIARVLLYPLRIQKTRKRERELRDRELINQQRQFDYFRQKYFHYSSEIYTSLKQLRKRPPQADCYVAGSDQIWGQLLSNPENEAFYLNFGSEDIKRISYAVSFGMKEYPADLCDILKRNLSRFDYISCREADGVKICADAGIAAERVGDPTLTVAPGIFEALLSDTVDVDNYIYLYSINVRSADEVRYSELKQFADTSCRPIIITTASGYIQGQQLYGEVPYKYATIGEWLSYIKNASLIVTPSFHGIVFSILFHRPFVYVPLGGSASQANNRVIDLLSDLELQSHVLTPSTRYEQLSILPYNWNAVDEKLQRLRYDAAAYLRETGITTNGPSSCGQKTNRPQ